MATSAPKMSPRSRSIRIEPSIAALAAFTSPSLTGCTNGRSPVQVDRDQIAAKLEEMAERGGVGLTPHAVAVERALAAVAAVDGRAARDGDRDDLSGTREARTRK
jgi:hypothetical protein